MTIYMQTIVISNEQSEYFRRWSIFYLAIQKVSIVHKELLQPAFNKCMLMNKSE